MSTPDPIGRIYLTAKAGMAAEARLRVIEIVSQVLVAWYSTCVIGLSLLDLSQSYRVRDVSVVTAILSVAILATSIFLYGRNFSLRAAAFRECYLQLQKIYWSDVVPAEKMTIYAETLPRFENHLQRDHEWALFTAWMLDKNLSDAEGPVVASRSAIVRCFARAILNAAIVAVLFAAPAVVGYLLVAPR